MSTDSARGCSNLKLIRSMLPNVKLQHIEVVAFIVIALLVFHFRHKIAAAHDRYRTRRRLGYSTSRGFQSDLEDGLVSDSFDITANINAHDQREGLSEDAKEEIKLIMQQKGIEFDQARLEYTQRKFQDNSIDSNGLPKDPKLVTL